MFLQNDGLLSMDYKPLYPRRKNSSTFSIELLHQISSTTLEQFLRQNI
jgi:hypothetical protein